MWYEKHIYTYIYIYIYKYTFLTWIIKIKKHVKMVINWNDTNKNYGDINTTLYLTLYMLS